MDRKQGSKSKDRKKKPAKPTPVAVQDEADENEEEPLEVRFEREVAWCKAEIFKRLHHVKLDSKQGYDLARALKILDSDKAEMIKKRQAMRTTLGDYRKKMKEDEKKQAAAAKKMTLKPAEESQAKLSKCYKMSSSQQKQIPETKPSTNQVDVQLSDLSLADSASQSNDPTDPSGANEKCETDTFKFVKTDNEFRFNFSKSEENSEETCGVNGEVEKA